MKPWTPALALLLAAGISASGATAQTRAMTPGMACAAIQALVQQRGAVILHTSPVTYDRVVRDQSACLYIETTEALNVPSADRPYCFAGYICRPRDLTRRR